MQRWLCLLSNQEKARIDTDLRYFMQQQRLRGHTGAWQCCGNGAKCLKRVKSKAYCSKNKPGDSSIYRKGLMGILEWNLWMN